MLMNANIFSRLRSLGGAFALIAAVTLTGLFASSDTAHAQPSFHPTAEYAVSDSTPNAPADIISSFGVPEGDVQYGATINFAPPEWEITPDADIPDGAIVAELTANAVLGLIGSGCNQQLPVRFDMLEATTDMSTTVPYNDPEAEKDPPDENDKQGNEPDDQFDISGGLPLGVTRYPDYLTRIFVTPDGTILTPITRAYGQTEVAGIEVSLNFVVLEPGIVLETPNGDIIGMDPRLGYPSATVLQAAGDPDTEADIEDNNSVNDFCSPLTVKTTIFKETKDNPDTTANEGGIPVRKNPAAGTYNFVMYALSQRDADGDGYENSLDTCPYDANPEWDPRETQGYAQAGDADGDGLGDACDPEVDIPSPPRAGVYDDDEDFYGNRGDNCPLIANSKGQLGGSGVDNQEDSDSDGIGDACDDNPNNADAEGQQAKVCLSSPIKIGGGGPAPDPPPQNSQPGGPNAPMGEVPPPTDDDPTDDDPTVDDPTVDDPTVDDPTGGDGGTGDGGAADGGAADGDTAVGGGTGRTRGPPRTRGAIG